MVQAFLSGIFAFIATNLGDLFISRIITYHPIACNYLLFSVAATISCTSLGASRKSYRFFIVRF
jgi:hypothetical protein